MDRRIKKYRDAIVSVMQEYADVRKHSVNGSQYELIADDTNLRYQLVLLGWHEKHRIYHVIFHVDIINGKIWVQTDNTEDAIANLLVEKGIGKKEIVLGYFTEFHRAHGEFAVA